MNCLENLIAKVDALVIGGAMANTFLLAQGIKVGKSLAEKDMADTARRILGKAEDAGCAIILPVDAIVAFHFEANAPAHAYGLDAIPGRRDDPRRRPAIDRAHQGRARRRRDAGLERPARRVRDARRSTSGTVTIARYAAERTKAHGLVSVAGGGDTVAALNAAHVGGRFTYVSTAGGAFLEWLEGRKLPGVEALRMRD